MEAISSIEGITSGVAMEVTVLTVIEGWTQKDTWQRNIVHLGTIDSYYDLV